MGCSGFVLIDVSASITTQFPELFMVKIIPQLNFTRQIGEILFCVFTN